MPGSGMDAASVSTASRSVGERPWAISFRTGSPLLRLPDGSRGGEVLEFAVVRHDGPPRRHRPQARGSLPGRAGQGRGVSRRGLIEFQLDRSSRRPRPEPTGAIRTGFFMTRALVPNEQKTE